MAPHDYQRAVRDEGFHGFSFYADHVFVFAQGPFHVDGGRDGIAFRKGARGDVADNLRAVFASGMSGKGRELFRQGNEGALPCPELTHVRRFIRQLGQPLAQGHALFRSGPFIFPHAFLRDFQHKAVGLDSLIFRLSRPVLGHQGVDFQNGVGGEGAGGGKPVVDRSFLRAAFPGEPVTVLSDGFQPVFHVPFCRCHGLMIHDFRELSIERSKLNP